MRLPAEEAAQAVAVGLSWVAASTSLNHLRVFSEGGLQVLIKVHSRCKENSGFASSVESG